MADQFMPAIKTLMDTFVSANGLGWTTVIQSSPRRTDWNTMPMVIICPAQDNKDVSYMAFGAEKNVRSNYNLYFVANNESVDTADSQEDIFQRACIALYMPVPNALILQGSWQARVDPQYDFDRKAFPSGYTIGCSMVSIDWIF